MTQHSTPSPRLRELAPKGKAVVAEAVAALEELARRGDSTPEEVREVYREATEALTQLAYRTADTFEGDVFRNALVGVTTALHRPEAPKHPAKLAQRAVYALDVAQGLLLELARH